MGDGRFGPVYVGIDPDSGQIILIRTFTETMTPEQRQSLIEALNGLCKGPLDHISIAAPIASGIEGVVPYFAHAYLPGEPVDEYLRGHGPRPLSEVASRVTEVAEAIDYAAAAGVHHGAIGPRDIIFAPESTGVSGFGLTQALRHAGIRLREPSLADDIYAIAAMTFELLVGHRYTGGDPREALSQLQAHGVDVGALAHTLESALSSDPQKWPSSAIQFAASLHDAEIDTPALAMKPSAPPRTNGEVGRLALGLEPLEAFESEETVLSTKGGAPHPTPVPPPTRAVTNDSIERPGLPLFDLSLHLHEAPPAEAEIVIPRLSDSPRIGRTDSRANRSSWRAFAVAVVVSGVLLGAVGAGIMFTQGIALDDQLFKRESTSSGPAAATGNQGSGTLDRGSGTADSTAPPPDRVTVTDDPVNSGDRDVAAANPESTGTARADSVDPVSPTQPAPVPGSAQVNPQPSLGSPIVPPVNEPGSPEPARQSPNANPATLGPQGRLLVRSVPAGARVLVDGAPRGETPVAVRGLELGPHTVVVTAPGYAEWEDRVTLTAERPSYSFEIPLNPHGSGPATGSNVVPAAPTVLQVDSRPAGAQVWVDGSLVGVTPLLLQDVTVGAHSVRIQLPGYRPWTTSVAVGRGERGRVAASLER
jgi:serine/threonine protein kinase